MLLGAPSIGAPKIRPVSAGTLSRDAPSPRPTKVGVERRAALRSPTVVAVAGLTVLAAVLRLERLGYQGFWYDEGHTVLLVHASPIRMLRLLPYTESTPPLYYCLAWLWAHVFGYGEAALRSLSAVAGIVTVPIVYGAAAKLSSRRAGVIAAALTACNPLLIWYSQEARSYALLALLSACSLMAFAYARAEPAPRALWAWGLAAALSLTTHYYALIVVVPQALWLLAVHRHRRGVRIAVGAVGACGLALVPLALKQNASGHASWIAQIPLLPRLGQIVPQFLIGFGAPARVLLERLAELGAVASLALLALPFNAAQRRGALIAGAIAGAGLVINLVLIAGGADDLITRNVIALWPPAAVLLAGGLATRGPAIARAAGIALAIGLCTIGLVAAIAVSVRRDLQRPDWRAVARALGPRPAPSVGRRVILVQHYRDLLPLSLYVPGLRSLPHGSTTVKELDVVAIRAPRVRLCWWGAACNLTGSQIQATYPIAGLQEVSRVRALQFTVVRLRSATGAPISRELVSAALRTTSLRRDELLLQR